MGVRLYSIFSLLITYYFMEKTSFSILDRYFSDKNEKRIGRVLFLIRTITIVTFIAILWYAIFAEITPYPLIRDFILSNIWIPDDIRFGRFIIDPLIAWFLFIILIFSLPILIKKRCHDFNNSGKILNILALISLIFSLYNGVSLPIWFALSWDSNPYLSTGVEVSTIFELAIDYIQIGLFIWVVLIWVFLLFYPGSKEVNMYGFPQK